MIFCLTDILVKMKIFAQWQTQLSELGATIRG